MNPNLPKREIKNIYIGDDARVKLTEGARKMAEVVGSTYGPSGNNVILGMPFGDSTLTRDGVTVAKRTILADKAEDDAAQIMRQASEKTNKSAGDGTTATIVLAYNLFNRGNRLVAAGENGMLLKKQIAKDSQTVIKFLEEQSAEAEGHLLDVATVSAGDPAIGALVADTVKEVGSSGGITIREQDYPTVDVEKVNGYYFDRGFFALTQQVELSKPHVYVTQKQLATNADIVPILSKVLNHDNKKLVIIGDVRMNSDAMVTLFLNLRDKAAQGFEAVIIPPPAYNDEGKLFMEDIATYTGSSLFMTADDPKDATIDDFGSAERVQIDQDRAIIFRGGGIPEDVETRAQSIKDVLDKETNSHRREGLEQRYSKLTGKIAIVNVGGSTQAEMEELRYRVEDAIEATKSAIDDGVLPGGATMLVRASELKISKLFKDALQDSFRKLMDNAAERADYRLEQVRHSEFGFGFNLRDMTDEPIDLREAGIWDATRAVVQTIENAASAAGSLLTVGAIVDPVEGEGNAPQI